MRRHRRHVRRSHRRARRNPRGIKLPGLFGVDLGAAALIGAGVVGSEIAAGAVSNFLPAAWKTGAAAPAVRIGTKAAVGIGVPYLLRGVIGRRISNLLITGTAVGLVLDAYHTWIAPMIGLTGYEAISGMGVYQPLLGEGDAAGEEAMGAGENMYSDTIY